MRARPEQWERLNVDVDTRLAPIWGLLWDEGSVLRSVLDDEEQGPALGAFLRAAYGLGYGDAHEENEQGRRGALYVDNGYVRPK
jgi:hypothetical protein